MSGRGGEEGHKRLLSQAGRETLSLHLGTHALVIGVGDYPHLNGGSNARTEHHDGMEQLTSPPIPARLFAFG